LDLLPDSLEFFWFFEKFDVDKYKGYCKNDKTYNERHVVHVKILLFY
jgi:hypothetical protein